MMRGKSKMSKILWRMIGVEAENNGLDEVEYKLECSECTRDVLYILYILATMLVPYVVWIIAMNDGRIISLIGSLLTWVVAVLLIPVLSPIIDGYHSAHKVLW